MRSHRIVGLVLLLAFLPVDWAIAQEVDPSEGPVFVAHDVEPTLKNTKDVKRVMRRVYPSGYRDTGLDVTTIMWVYVDAEGNVGARQVLKSSGYAVFDRAAEELVDAMVFNPALRGDEPIGVWINKAIKFNSGDSRGFIEGPARLAEEPKEPEGDNE